MGSSEERLKILQMVEEGTLSADEASRLLKALGKQDRNLETPQGEQAKWLRVRITESESDKPSLDINLPVSMVNVGLKMGARLIPDTEGLDLDMLGEALRQGLTGKILDVVDEEDGDHIEVFLE